MMTAHYHSEKIGVLFVMVSTILWGVFLIIINRGVQSIPPLTFAAFTSLIGALGAFGYSLHQKKLGEISLREAYFPLLMITLCISLVPSIFLFIGTAKTNALNTSLLGLTEIIFTLIFTHFFGEKTTLHKLAGALGIFVGANFILYRGTWQLNIGDLLIILSTALYPIGNYYGKKALNLVSPATILLVRWGLSGLFLLLLAALFEGTNHWTATLAEHWPLLFFCGFILYCLSKIFWYESLKRLDITKAVSLGMTYPLFSLIIIFIMGEKISLFQSIGIIIIFIGVVFTILRPSVRIYEH